MSPRISVLCPTRGRPGNVERMASSALVTASGPVELVFYCDDDAPGSVPGTAGALDSVKVITGPRIVMSDMWNRCWEHASADVFMQCGDDIVFRTPGWDDIVLGAFGAIPDRIAFVYGRDGHREDTYGTHGFLHRKWTDTVGYFTPPYFSCDWSETWLNDIASRLGRKVLVPILTEHMHPNAGKHPWDATHQERAERGARDNPEALYASLEHERAADAAKLRAVMA